jgi:hypothetical protein
MAFIGNGVKTGNTGYTTNQRSVWRSGIQHSSIRYGMKVELGGMMKNGRKNNGY